MAGSYLGDPVAETDLEPSDIAIASVDPLPLLEKYFAGGPGELHFYGLETPFALYP